MARRVASSGTSLAAARETKPSGEPAPEEDDSIEEITRCICGNQEFIQTSRTKALRAVPGLYVQCERCNVWQHGFCMGFLQEEDISNEYYCEQCEPTFHRISQRQGVLMSKYRPHESKQANGSPSSSSARQTRSNSATPDQEDGSPSVPTKHEKSARGRRASKSLETGGSNGATDDKNTQEASQKGSSKPSKIKAEDPGKSAQNKPVKEESPDEADDADVSSGGKNETGANRVDSEDDDCPKADPESRPGEGDDSKGDDSKGDDSKGDDSKAASRKRRSRQPSEADASFMRNRKRRSREDEILQRVLEESAREAREAESRRRSKEGLPEDEQAVKDETSESMNDQNDEDSHHSADTGAQTVPRTRRSRRNASGTDSNDQDQPNIEERPSESESRRKDSHRNGAGRPASSRGTNNGAHTPSDTTSTPALGRRRGARTSRSTIASTANGSAEHSPASPRRGVNGGPRRSKPRVPSQRSTFDEMRRRVSAILEFSSRTQDELINEQKTRIVALQPPETDTEKGLKYEQLLGMSETNLNHLEELTSKLLKWEEKFGIRNSL